jgi:hypothetical protein
MIKDLPMASRERQVTYFNQVFSVIGQSA